MNHKNDPGLTTLLPYNQKTRFGVITIPSSLSACTHTLVHLSLLLLQLCASLPSSTCQSSFLPSRSGLSHTPEGRVKVLSLKVCQLFFFIALFLVQLRVVDRYQPRWRFRVRFWSLKCTSSTPPLERRKLQFLRKKSPREWRVPS
ncbi:hypothetical protein DFH94DRAFT_781685 [Russula ochroleuca]|uniref:Transmembrane protein n=1 Tax=Russula ochroleuca TaxID=152965 RepID=A0A9P5JV81_9AGAM|nr:hypothetical protein DFH94DRAFT_781685 [Russula ochroleuca]